MYALITLLTTILISIAIIPISPTESLAHRDGCHRWHSCPPDDGSYVCGDLGHDDECGVSKEGNEDNEEEAETANDDPISKNNDGNGNKDDINNGEQLTIPSNECQGQADCFTGIVTDIVDGDMLDVNNMDSL
jgi:hypothetical protein